MQNKLHIVGISGSLRENSSNTEILKTIFNMLPANVDYTIFSGLDLLPHFNPGREENEGVVIFKKVIAAADGVIICTPEYAFGVPGVLKNALDWTVSSGEFNEKPVAAISASPLNSGGEDALASLLLTLTALGTRFNHKSSLSIPNIKMKSNDDGKLTNRETITQLQAQLDNLLGIIG